MPLVTKLVALDGFVGSEVVLAFLKLRIAKNVIKIPTEKIILAVIFCPIKVKLPIVIYLSMIHIDNPKIRACKAGGILSCTDLFFI